MKCTPYNKESLKEAVQILKKGGVIAHPADTCYGLAADPMNPDAIKRIQTIKGRDKNRPMSIMLPVFMKLDIDKYAIVDDFSLSICKKLLPGPITILLPKGPKIPDYFFPESPYIGLRIPYEMMTQDILMKFKGPLITTSANLSGEPPCSTSNEVKKMFSEYAELPDILFEDNIRNFCMPSTVILVENEKIKIMREGPMTKKQLENILGVAVS